MDKRKKIRYSGCKNCKIGIPLSIKDKNDESLYSGDIIMFHSERCIILWNMDSERWEAHILRTMWYGDNIYDSRSYGKVYSIHMKNGDKLSIQKVEGVKFNG